MKHFENLIETGLLPTEIIQIATMSAAAISHGYSALLKIGAAILQAVPDTELGGIEIVEVQTGGSTFRDAAATLAEIPASAGKALAIGGEISEIYAKLDLFEPGGISILFDAQEALVLRDSQYLITRNLTISSKGTDLVLTVNGDKNNFRNINLVIGYQATVN